jgi:hypothetical protein
MGEDRTTFAYQFKALITLAIDIPRIRCSTAKFDKSQIPISRSNGQISPLLSFLSPYLWLITANISRISLFSTQFSQPTNKSTTNITYYQLSYLISFEGILITCGNHIFYIPYFVF